MKKKLLYGLSASVLMLVGAVGTVHAAWDTSGVDLVLDATFTEELDALAAVVPELGNAVLTVEETEVAIKTLLPTAVASSVSGGVHVTGNATSGTTLGRVAKLRSEALYARLQNAPVGPAGPTSSQNVLTTGVWGKGIGSIGDQDAIDGVDGYEFDAKGAMFGVDWLASRNWLVGVTVGSVDTGIDGGYNKTANTQIDSLVAGMYATYSRGIDYLDLGFSFLKGEISSNRQVIVGPISYKVAGETDFSTYAVYANLGRNFVFNSRHIVNPYLGANFSCTTVEGYSEIGIGSLQFSEQQTNLFNTNLGLKYEYVAANQIHLKARASWAHEWSDNLQSITRSRFTALGAGGSYFETKGLDVGADRFGLGLGLKLNMTENLNMDLDYDLELAEEFISHAGSVAFKYRY